MLKSLLIWLIQLMILCFIRCQKSNMIYNIIEINILYALFNDIRNSFQCANDIYIYYNILTI